METNNIFPKFAFFGSSEFSVFVLQRLAEENIKPFLIITTEDKPRGRHLRLSPTPVKKWALEKNIPVFTNISEAEAIAKENEIFLVASYGKILPRKILDIPKYGVLNIHPSLLPKYRGPSPIQSAILNGDKETGITIMLMDEKVDHGPIISQKYFLIRENMDYEEMEKTLAFLGAEEFMEIAPKYILGQITPIPQNHQEASYTKLIKKQDGEINLKKNTPQSIDRKIRAFRRWPNVYFFVIKNNKPFRVIITKAKINKDILEIEKVKPEGGKEMSWQDFKKIFPSLNGI